jgi:hypothetical protein
MAEYNPNFEQRIFPSPFNARRLYGLYDFFPDVGPEWGDNRIYLSGLGFLSPGISEVRFGNSVASGVTVINNRQITCVAPSGAQFSNADVIVTFNNGQTVTYSRQYKYSGWTTLSALPSNASAVYVSEAGNDSNSGFTSALAKRTVSAGMNILNALPNGRGHRLYLSAGNSWDEPLGQLKISGESAANRVVITSYGTGARPKIKGTSSISNQGAGLTTGLGGGSASAINYVAIIGLEIYKQNYAWEPINNQGIGIAINANDWLIEDNYIHDVTVGIVAGANTTHTVSNIKIRRNILYNLKQHGIYSDTNQDLVIEENSIIYAGYNDTIPTSVPNASNKHAIYIKERTTTSPPVIRNNFVMYGSMNGIMARSGGFVYGNFSGKQPTNIQFGGGEIGYVGGVSGMVRANVVYGSRNTYDGTRTGTGIGITNAKQVAVTHNIIIKNTSGTLGAALNIDGRQFTNNSPINVGVSAIITDNEVFNWSASTVTNEINHFGLLIQGPKNNIDLKLQRNIISEYNSSTVSLIRHAYGDIFTYPDNLGPTSIESINNTFYRASGSDDLFEISFVNPDILNITEWTDAVSDTNSTVAVPTFSDTTRTLETYSTSKSGNGTEAQVITNIIAQSRANFNNNYSVFPIIRYFIEGF